MSAAQWWIVMRLQTWDSLQGDDGRPLEAHGNGVPKRWAAAFDDYEAAAAWAGPDTQILAVMAGEGGAE